MRDGTKTYEGTEVKYRVWIHIDGFDMSSDDFDITIANSNGTQRVFQKSDLVERPIIEDGEVKTAYYLCFDTSEFGPGSLVAIVRAYVPDQDFPDGHRTVIDKLDLVNVRCL